MRRALRETDHMCSVRRQPAPPQRVSTLRVSIRVMNKESTDLCLLLLVRSFFFFVAWAFLRITLFEVLLGSEGYLFKNQGEGLLQCIILYGDSGLWSSGLAVFGWYTLIAVAALSLAIIMFERSLVAQSIFSSTHCRTHWKHNDVALFGDCSNLSRRPFAYIVEMTIPRFCNCPHPVVWKVSKVYTFLYPQVVRGCLYPGSYRQSTPIKYLLLLLTTDINRLNFLFFTGLSFFKIRKSPFSSCSLYTYNLFPIQPLDSIASSPTAGFKAFLSLCRQTLSVTFILAASVVLPMSLRSPFAVLSVVMRIRAAAPKEESIRSMKCRTLAPKSGIVIHISPNFVHFAIPWGSECFIPVLPLQDNRWQGGGSAVMAIWTTLLSAQTDAMSAAIIDASTARPTRDIGSDEFNRNNVEARVDKWVHFKFQMSRSPISANLFGFMTKTSTGMLSPQTHCIELWQFISKSAGEQIWIPLPSSFVSLLRLSLSSFTIPHSVFLAQFSVYYCYYLLLQSCFQVLKSADRFLTLLHFYGFLFLHFLILFS